MPSDRRSRMSMNNEARNLRLSILLFFQRSARLASARQFGPHTRIGYRSSIYVYVRTVSHARRYIRTYTYVWAFVWVARTFRKQSSRLARESSSALGDETDASIPETARYTTKKRQRNLLLCLRISMYVYVYTPWWWELRIYVRRTRVMNIWGDTLSHPVRARPTSRFPPRWTSSDFFPFSPHIGSVLSLACNR